MPDDTLESLSQQLARWREARHLISLRLHHDLRAALTAIVGFAELLADANLPPVQQAYLQRILEATDKIVAIVDEVQEILNEVEQHN